MLPEPLLRVGEEMVTADLGWGWAAQGRGRVTTGRRGEGPAAEWVWGHQ